MNEWLRQIKAYQNSTGLSDDAIIEKLQQSDLRAPKTVIVKLRQISIFFSVLLIQNLNPILTGLTITAWYSTVSKGNSIARFGTRKTCKEHCEWEDEKTRMHEGDAFKMTNGEIIIQTRGYYSIIAQLHNKNGNNGKWIRTNIKINDVPKARR